MKKFFTETRKFLKGISGIFPIKFVQFMGKIFHALQVRIISDVNALKFLNIASLYSANFACSHQKLSRTPSLFKLDHRF